MAETIRERPIVPSDVYTTAKNMLADIKLFLESAKGHSFDLTPRERGLLEGG